MKPQNRKCLGDLRFEESEARLVKKDARVEKALDSAKFFLRTASKEDLQKLVVVEPGREGRSIHGYRTVKTAAFPSVLVAFEYDSTTVWLCDVAE